MGRLYTSPAKRARQAADEACVAAGRQARWDGVPGDACPYPATHLRRRHLWLVGWVQTAHDTQQRDPLSVMRPCDH
jgi:ribosome modulation factor